MPVGQTFTEDEVKQALMAVVAWNGNVTAAVEWLENEADPPLFLKDATVRTWVNKDHAIEYQRIRDEYGSELERNLADSFRGVAGKAVEVQMLALMRAHERLTKNLDADPAKTASFAARAGGTAVEKLMTLTNRPEKITETRDINDTLRSLVGRGVLKMIPGGQTVDGTVEDEPDVA